MMMMITTTTTMMMMKISNKKLIYCHVDGSFNVNIFLTSFNQPCLHLQIRENYYHIIKSITNDKKKKKKKNPTIES